MPVRLCVLPVSCVAPSLLVLCAACSNESAESGLTAAVPDIQCVPRGLGAEGLDDEWQPFAAHIQACVVVDPQGTPALEILAVSASGLGDTQRTAVPRPVILLPGGRPVGRLPYNYPDDPPVTTTLEFAQWQAGIPYRITIRVQGRSGAQVLAMMWDGTNRRYNVADQR